MRNGIEEYVEQLQHRDSPESAVIAATAIGREGRILRQELEEAPHVLGPGDADRVLSALTLAVWDMAALPEQRAASAWALGQVGGAEPAAKLLNRLEALFVQKGARVLGPADPQHQAAETDEVRAALVEALGRALDAPAGRKLTPSQRGQLRNVWQALLQALSGAKDPDLFTALALTLAKLARRMPDAVPRGALARLLNAPEPTALLAGIGILSDVLSGDEREAAASYVYEGKPSAEVAEALRQLGEARGRPYMAEEAQHLVQMAVQFWYAEVDTRVAEDLLWERMASANS